MRKRTTATPEVDAASQQLKEALEDSARIDDTTFASANKAHEQPFPGYFDRIIEKVMVNDPDAAYTRITKWLRFGEKRSDLSFLRSALADAPSIHNDAHSLLVTAKLDRDNIERTNAVIWNAMRMRATDGLQQEKREGLRSKQISEADVDAYCSVHFPDEWKRVEHARYRAKQIVDQFESLVKTVSIATGVLETLVKA